MSNLSLLETFPGFGIPELCAVVRARYESYGPPDDSFGYLDPDLVSSGPVSFNPARAELNFDESCTIFDVYKYYEKLKQTGALRLAFGNMEGEALMEMGASDFSILFPANVPVFLFRSGALHRNGTKQFPYVYLDEKGIIRRHWFPHRYLYGPHAAPQFRLEEYETWL
jgi:hypothetical protein